MMIFDWITRKVSAAVSAGFADALEKEGPHFRAEPGPPLLQAAAEISPRVIGSDSEPVKNGKRIAKASA